MIKAIRKWTWIRFSCPVTVICQKEDGKREIEHLKGVRRAKKLGQRWVNSNGGSYRVVLGHVLKAESYEPMVLSVLSLAKGGSNEE